MGMIFGKSWSDPSENWNDGNTSWWTSSKTDSRFNLNGRCWGIWGAHSEAEKAIKAKEKELNCKAPEDLEIGACKD